MSVPKHKRGISNMQFYQTARDLRKKVTQKLISDFGLKHKVRQIHIYGDKLLYDNEKQNAESNYDDTEIIAVEHTKNISKELTIIESYPMWLMNIFRTAIMDAFRRLMYDITMANSIFSTTDYELAERRLWQDRAICECEYLIQEFQYAGDIMPIKFSTLVDYAGELVKLIALLRGWRSANKKLKDKLSKNVNTVEKSIQKRMYQQR